MPLTIAAEDAIMVSAGSAAPFATTGGATLKVGLYTNNPAVSRYTNFGDLRVAKNSDDDEVLKALTTGGMSSGFDAVLGCFEILPVMPAGGIIFRASDFASDVDPAVGFFIKDNADNLIYFEPFPAPIELNANDYDALVLPPIKIKFNPNFIL